MVSQGKIVLRCYDGPAGRETGICMCVYDILLRLREPR